MGDTMEIMKIWDKEIPLYDETIKNEHNEEINTLFFFPVSTQKPAPMVIIFSGGGYGFRNNTGEGIPIAEFLNTCGYHAAVVNYRVNPYHYPAPLLDAQRAIKLFRYNAEKYAIDPEKIFTLGYSAGGHLCGMTATFEDICTAYGDAIDAMSHKPNGAIMVYPVISADDDKMHRGSFEYLLGDAYEEKANYSIEKRVNEETCPCLLFHCAGDTLVRPINSLVMTQSLMEKGICYETHIFKDGCHGGGMKKNDPHANIWPQIAANWIANLK